MKKKLLVFILPLSICVSAQVGVNTTTPTAQLDAVSKTAVPANKVLNIQNSNTINANNLSIYEDSRSYMGKPDNITPNATTDALVNIYGATNRSAIRLNNAPSTENQSDGTARPGIDYNHLTPLYADVNGNIVKAADPYSAISTSANFDGVYNVPNTAAGIKIVDASPVSLITFKFATSLTFGVVANGANILGTVNFGVNTGFSYSDFISGSGSGITRYPVSIVIDNQNTVTSIAAYNPSLTVNFAGSSPINLVFFYQNGAIYARNTGSNGTPIPIAIMQSKRYR
ncbi:hypothetical protein [Chryseobacterium sp. JUb7]|uniref:hypothetical protein n=1 Tax=Chryseobacterium sp. JUb7 TaxID=2940599 RepID=UPI00216A35DF|nr:hypothetical protein [Chryseobacterium sp. JUb7]MCS3529098.1 hypothetical protein [Chryseobacterium sp. JUb7]